MLVYGYKISLNFTLTAQTTNPKSLWSIDGKKKLYWTCNK